MGRWVEQPVHGKLNKLMPFLSGVELRITHCIAPHSANRPRADRATVTFRACRIGETGTETTVAIFELPPWTSQYQRNALIAAELPVASAP